MLVFATVTGLLKLLFDDFNQFNTFPVLPVRVRSFQLALVILQFNLKFKSELELGIPFSYIKPFE